MKLKMFTSKDNWEKTPLPSTSLTSSSHVSPGSVFPFETEKEKWKTDVWAASTLTGRVMQSFHGLSSNIPKHFIFDQKGVPEKKKPSKRETLTTMGRSTKSRHQMNWTLNLHCYLNVKPSSRDINIVTRFCHEQQTPALAR